MGKNKKLVKNISFVLIGNIGSKLMGFIMLPLYTRWLSPSDYGVVDTINVYTLLLINVIALDVSDAIFVFPSNATTEKITKYYSTGFLFQILGSLFCAIIFYILSFYPSDSTFFQYIWLVYGCLITSLFQKYSQDFCRGINKMSVFSFTGIIQSISIALFSFLLIPQWNIWGYVMAMIIANIITFLFTFFYSHSYKYLSVKQFRIAELKEMLHYSIPIIPSSILWWFVTGINRPLLEQYTGVFFIGLLAVANKFTSIMSMTYNLFQQAWMVTVLEEFKKEDFSNYFTQMYRNIIILQTFVCFIIIIFSKTIVQFITTEEYYEAWKFIPLISIGVIFSNTSNFIGTLFSASRKSIYIFYTAIISGGSAFLLNFLLIPSFGLWGACIALVLSQVIGALTRIQYAKKFVTFNNNIFLMGQISILIICYLTSLYTSIELKMSIYSLLFLLILFNNKKEMIYIYSLLSNKLQKRH